MDKPPMHKTDEPKIETPPQKEIIVDNSPKKEKKKFSATIVDTTDLMKKQSEDVGNEKMTMEVESEELSKAGKWEKLGKKEFWSRLGQKAWKFGMARDYYRNKEIYKASTEILKEQNVFVGEGKNKDAHNKVMSDIIDQFTSGYDDTIHKEAGEKKIEVKGEDEKEKANKEQIKQLIKDYATGKIDKAAFQEQEKRIFNDLKGKVDEKEVKGNTMYASNLFDVAEQMKLAIKNQEFLENEDFEIDVVYGISKASVRTEAHYTNTERIIKKMLHTEVGQFVNETSIAIALSCASSLIARTAASLPGKVVPIIGTAAISSWFANVRAKTEEEEKRKLHFRQIAKGENFDSNNSKKMPNRTEMENFRYKTESASDLIKGIDANLKTLETSGVNLTGDELNAILGEISALEAKVRLSDRRNIDLITYSDTTKVVEERKSIDIKKRQLKDALQKSFADKNIPLPVGQKDFESYYSSIATTEENRLISEENTGIDAKDRCFNKMKSEKGRKAAWTAFKTGIIVGATLQEVTSLFTDRVGIVEDIAHQIKGQDTLVAGVGTENLTALASLKHFLQGDTPKMSMGNIHEVLVGENKIKLPEGVDMIKNTDGTYNLINGDRVLGEHLTMNADGSLSESAKSILAQSGVGIENHLIEGVTEKTVSPEDYIKNHTGVMKEIHRMGWFDNDTKDFDLNELKTHLGGIDGTGIDADGNYVINVGKMMPDGSFHEALSVDAQKLMQVGSLKMLFSLSKDTQGHAFEFTVSPKGEIIIPPGSEAGKVLFENIKGHLQFNGRFGEVAQDMGNGKYMMLSTMEGKGLDEIIDKVQSHAHETVLTTPGDYDWQMPPFIPVVKGNPLEKLMKGEKQKEDGVNVIPIIKKEEGDINPKDNKEENIDVITVPVNIDKTEKQKTINEISKEAYDAMYDDLKMINRKIQTSNGIITVSEDDFKSAYGKKRYLDLKSIQDGIPVRFNKDELQTIGDELEGLLSKSKIISKEELEKRLEKENKAKSMEGDMKHDLEMLNKTIKESKGIITLSESDFKSDFGKEQYKKLKSIPDGKNITFNKDELQTIGDEMEKNLIDYQKEINNKKETPREELEINKKVTPEIKKETDEEKISNIKKEVEKEFELKNTNDIKEVAPENKPSNEKIFNVKDLSKIGTEFESKDGTYKITKVEKRGLSNLFGSLKTTVIFKDKNGIEKLLAYKNKDLAKEFGKGNIKITKTLEEK